MYPDIRVVERGRGKGSAAVLDVLRAAEPLILNVEDEPMTETFIEIIDIGSGGARGHRPGGVESHEQASGRGSRRCTRKK